jgi:elongation factor Ts
LVDISGDAVVGRDVAMHVAAGAAPGAIRPVAVSRNDVPAELVEKERTIYAAQAADSGKPADIVAKMVEGRVNKYLSEITLLGQPFVKNPDETVEKFLKAKGATVNGFTLFVVGEGIEKKKDDFAAEVAAMTKA